jgi:thiol-disulfide isomerase/thioredoxin
MKIQVINSYEDFEECLGKYNYIIVNISASWCKPCVAIKPMIEKFIKVINEDDFIYLKIDHDVYETDNNFHKMFHMKKIPYFSMFLNKNLKDSIVSGDFLQVSKRIYDFIKQIKENNSSYETVIENILENENNNNNFSKTDDF